MADRARQHGSIMPCLVAVYMCLPIVLSFSFGGLSIYPEGTILVRRGEALEMVCTTDCSADDIQFVTVVRDTVPSEKINDTAIRVNKKMDVNGIYIFYCIKTKECNGRRQIMTTRVLVDEAPPNVTDFQCKSYNLDELKCSWTNYGSVAPFSRSLFINGRKSDPCVTVRGKFKQSSTTYCTWDTTSLPRYRQLERQFMFTLTSSNAFGSNEQNFTVDHYSIVQPARVTSLKVLEIDTYSATLQWKIPHNMVDILPSGVVHKIEYQIANIDNSSVFRSVEASSLPKKNFTYCLDLSLPYAHMQYVVKLSIRPVEATGEQYWSEPSVVTFYTKGKSTGEIAADLYKIWRKNMNEVPQAFSSKLWHMKAEKHLNNIWTPKERATLALTSVLNNGNRFSENGHNHK